MQIDMKRIDTEINMNPVYFPILRVRATGFQPVCFS